MPRSASSSSTSRQDRPSRRYQRTLTAITSRGNRYPAGADDDVEFEVIIRSLSGPTDPTNATDIPGFSMSSGGAVAMRPGGGFVVAGAGLQTAVQDADEAVGELAER